MYELSIATDIARGAVSRQFDRSRLAEPHRTTWAEWAAGDERVELRRHGAEARVRGTAARVAALLRRASSVSVGRAPWPVQQ